MSAHPSDEAMIQPHDDGGYRQVLPGITMKTLAWGRATQLCKFHLQKGSLLPRHAHPNEQTGIMLTGRMRFTIGDETVEVHPGDSWSIPAGLEHSAELLEDSVIIEVFSPVRPEYLPSA